MPLHRRRFIFRNSNSWSRRHRPERSPPSERRTSHGRSQGRKSPAPKEERSRGRPTPAPAKSATSSQAPETQAPPPPPPQAIPRLGVHQAHPVPVYPPAQAHAMPHPNYPPPGYDQYGNYVPYMGQGWPMYPPPPLGPGMMPPQGASHVEYSSPYLKVIETVPADGNDAKKQEKKPLNMGRPERAREKDPSKDLYSQEKRTPGFC
ncbi:hypothetical protein AALO_G00229110 [Alosa alosa]|uniref:Uncharacterized protein n=1 Tax=Alosa alosa TaxID=278164 RepID=A0AAV6FXZ4_9TELE|nr:hypothetical protein AALO_G00229110 [Alosa alosa]